MGDAVGEGKAKAGMELMSICSGRWRITLEVGGEVAGLEEGLSSLLEAGRSGGIIGKVNGGLGSGLKAAELWEGYASSPVLSSWAERTPTVGGRDISAMPARYTRSTEQEHLLG